MMTNKAVDVRGVSSEHILHLYTSEVDKFPIHKHFLSSVRRGEGAAILTFDYHDVVRKELGSVSHLSILDPTEIDQLEAELGHSSRLNLIVDEGSLPGQTLEQVLDRENRIDELTKKEAVRCLCTYKVGGIFGQIIRPVSSFHNLLQLTTSDFTLISGESLESLQVSYDCIKRNVKDNLDTIILALIQERAMTGLEIIKTISTEFDVLLSPGAVYPLLDSLEAKGLLSSLRVGKERIYEARKGSRTEIRQLIDDQIQARKLLNNYLQNRSRGHAELDPSLPKQIEKVATEV